MEQNAKGRCSSGTECQRKRSIGSSGTECQRKRSIGTSGGYIKASWVASSAPVSSPPSPGSNAMENLSTLICVLGLLFLLSGSAHSMCPTNDKCLHFGQTTGRGSLGICLARSLVDRIPHMEYACPKEGSQLCQSPQDCSCCAICSSVLCKKIKGHVCMTKEFAVRATWFDYKKDCKTGAFFCKRYPPIPSQGRCFCCPEKPPMEDSCLDKGCKQAFDDQGICVNISVADWNLSPDIDLTFGMKMGLCSSMNKESYCGCFKKKEETPSCKDDNKNCKSNKKMTKKCYKENDAPANYFWTGKVCNNKKECKCYQRCKSNKKCSNKKGKCIAADQKPPAGWKATYPCDKKKNCICYIKG